MRRSHTVLAALLCLSAAHTYADSTQPKAIEPSAEVPVIRNAPVEVSGPTKKSSPTAAKSGVPDSQLIALPPQPGQAAKSIPVDPITEATAPAPAASTANKSTAKPVVQRPVNAAPTQSGVALTETAALNPTLASANAARQSEAALPLSSSQSLVNPLPGIGAPNDAVVGGGRPIIVRSIEGVTQRIPVSELGLTRIVTPFLKPKLIARGALKKVTEGNSVILQVKGNSDIDCFVVEDGGVPGSPMIALTLVPKAIPTTTVMLELETGNGKTYQSGTSGETAPASDDYTAYLKWLVRTVITGGQPGAMSKEKLDIASGSLPGGLRITPEMRYSGAALDVYQYRIVNTGSAPVTLSEQGFYQTGVKAVAIHPKLEVRPGQETRIYVVAGKAGDK